MLEHSGVEASMEIVCGTSFLDILVGFDNVAFFAYCLIRGQFSDSSTIVLEGITLSLELGYNKRLQKGMESANLQASDNANIVLEPRLIKSFLPPQLAIEPSILKNHPKDNFVGDHNSWV
ncbi:unnamed protein product [Ilex paraguariensis]|uniref:Uncharacterized protein n=1 Tax=Ilex paraguariensis TaxID=185542 RepID=A0ABC8QQG2_9AQUA